MGLHTSQIIGLLKTVNMEKEHFETDCFKWNFKFIIYVVKSSMNFEK